MKNRIDKFQKTGELRVVFQLLSYRLDLLTEITISAAVSHAKHPEESTKVIRCANKTDGPEVYVKPFHSAFAKANRQRNRSCFKRNTF